MSDATTADFGTQTTDDALGMPPTRRAVLATLAVCGCCAVAGSATSASAAPEDRAPATQPGRSDVGALADFARDGIYDGHARTQQIFLIRQGATLYASSSLCTHKRCILKKKKEEDGLKCPCHQSEFDLAGVPLGGPAKTSLVRYAITVENGRVFVDTSKSFAEKDWNAEGATLKYPSH